MKRMIFFVALLFLLVGAVAASEDVNGTDDQETLLLDETPVGEEMESSENVEIIANESGEPTQPPATSASDVSVSDVKGTANAQITLKTTVSNAAKGTQVTFKLNGQTYNAATDDNGVASVVIKCPPTAALKTTTKTTSNRLIKTTPYLKTYDATVTVGNITKTFKVTSTKASSVVKYKIIKKTKTYTLKIKRAKEYKKGKYAIAVAKIVKKGYARFAVAVSEKKTRNSVKFYIKEHYKVKNKKWKWERWFKVPKGKIYDSGFYYAKQVKIDKFKVKFTYVTYKRI